MSALAITGDTVFRWCQGRAEVIATPVGSLGKRLVLADLSERYWVVEANADCMVTAIICGPVTGVQAFHAAECVVAGVHDHHSVTSLIMTLAVGVVVADLKQEARQ